MEGLGFRVSGLMISGPGFGVMGLQHETEGWRDEGTEGRRVGGK